MNKLKRILKKHWVLILICLIQVITITLDAIGVIDWKWYYVYAPLLLVGTAIVITPYVVLAVHYYNTKDLH